MTHTFHIPVLGLAFSIDSALKVAQYGISSVMSIVDDELIERMRRYYCGQYQISYHPIAKTEEDYRAKRITAYLNLVQFVVNRQIEALKRQPFTENSELTKYFQLLPDSHPSKPIYHAMEIESNRAIKTELQDLLINYLKAGDIDVNIMSKVDKMNYQDGNLLDQRYSDASAALRGFANSTLHSSLILSAGMNPHLYAYLAELPAFFPNSEGLFDKKVVLKVSDFRSALIQAKYLAKRGVWVSEFRIESGLNCGGHAFATDGFLLGPILQEFKEKKESLKTELFEIYHEYWTSQERSLTTPPIIKYTVQGGVGTASEHQFLLNYYGFDAVGWGSPFLMVPEATTVDQETLKALETAKQEDFYCSGASPLGIPFNNFRQSGAEYLRLERIKKGRPGSPCKKEYLISNTEFSDKPICTASRVYQHQKIQELQKQNLSVAEYDKAFDAITEKTCLCEGLAAPAYLKYNIQKSKEQTAVSICPGPNLVWFKKQYSLREMIDHIYGRISVFENDNRPFVMINELNLYIDHIQKYVTDNKNIMNDKKIKYVAKFKAQLQAGIAYYNELTQHLSLIPHNISTAIPRQLELASLRLKDIHM
ncbi:hypothetical protein I6I98_01315 [Sphingobacterium multivorum]|uniref:Uncharacterized protein n=1 Tax=Sphingobacterium multivorum TaxID=28454 RepID=A0ABX7CPD7_SPHMU|nr:hypothetical protein [Sphingobacterium multivorum]QQT53940.1 hypothetical protein I6I98_01315 [Sphingobacterium multivorum]